MFTQGTMKEYTAKKDFNLNFEDRTIKSVKVRTGEVLLYDGMTAEVISGGIKTVGRCPSLKAAIAKLGWLVPAIGEAVTMENPVKASQTDYDDFKGGNFNTFLNSKGLNGERRGKMEVVRQENRVVKTLDTGTKTVTASDDSSVVEEQVPVRENLMVGSSTTVPRSQKHSAKLIQSENGGAQSSIPIKGPQKKEASDKRKSFTVDSTTPSVPEDATMADVRRATQVISVESGAQNTTVVKKIGQAADVVSAEGITLRKTVSREASAKARVGSGDREINTKAKVSAGESMPDIGGEVTVVKKIVDTSSDIPVKKAGEADYDPLLGGSFDTDMKQGGLNKDAATPVVEENPDYLSMLPENWGDMHWAQKEKFIMGLTDMNFIKFIQTVETTAAVQNACTERLTQLEST
jgi:hypothetical protein